VAWSPTCCDAARRLTARLKKNISTPISWRHYFGYVGAMSLMQRIATAGTTDPEKLATAFENYTIEAYKPSKSTYLGYDHQLAQDVFAGSVVNSKTFARTQFMYEIVGEIQAADSDGGPSSPWATAAKAAMAAQKVSPRPNYTPKTF
jgi:hypothetical protein